MENTKGQEEQEILLKPGDLLIWKKSHGSIDGSIVWLIIKQSFTKYNGTPNIHIKYKRFFFYNEKTATFHNATYWLSTFRGGLNRGA